MSQNLPTIVRNTFTCILEPKIYSFVYNLYDTTFGWAFRWLRTVWYVIQNILRCLINLCKSCRMIKIQTQMSSSFLIVKIHSLQDVFLELDEWVTGSPSTRSYQWEKGEFSVQNEKNSNITRIADLHLVTLIVVQKVDCDSENKNLEVMGVEIMVASGAGIDVGEAKKSALKDFRIKYPNILQTPIYKKVYEPPRPSKKRRRQYRHRKLRSENYDQDSMLPVPPEWRRLSEKEKVKQLDEELEDYFVRGC